MNSESKPPGDENSEAKKPGNFFGSVPGFLASELIFSSAGIAKTRTAVRKFPGMFLTGGNSHLVTDREFPKRLYQMKLPVFLLFPFLSLGLFPIAAEPVENVSASPQVAGPRRANLTGSPVSPARLIPPVAKTREDV
jgi:hypothetical protein